MRALSHYWRVTRQDNVVAQALLEKAIAIDPNYGQALGVLATSYMFTAHMGWMDMLVAMPTAERAALAAIQADTEDPWAHNALGHVYLFARRFDDSLAEFERALRLNPNFALAQGYYGLSLSYSGRWQDGDKAAGRALRLSPRDPYSAVYIGIAAYAQFLGGDYEEAMRLAREALRQRGDFVGAHRVLTAAAGMAGQMRRCRRGATRASPGAAQRLAGLDRRPNADQERRRPRALPGRFPPRRPGVAAEPPGRDGGCRGGSIGFPEIPSDLSPLTDLQPVFTATWRPTMLNPRTFGGIGYRGYRGQRRTGDILGGRPARPKYSYTCLHHR